ncbi:hypothetical protein [Streptomyces chryseus]
MTNLPTPVPAVGKQAPTPVPLHIARTVAQQFLTEAQALDASTATPSNVYSSWGALRTSLAQVLAALDAEIGQ